MNSDFRQMLCGFHSSLHCCSCKEVIGEYYGKHSHAGYLLMSPGIHHPSPQPTKAFLHGFGSHQREHFCFKEKVCTRNILQPFHSPCWASQGKAEERWATNSDPLQWVNQSVIWALLIQRKWEKWHHKAEILWTQKIPCCFPAQTTQQSSVWFIFPQYLMPKTWLYKSLSVTKVVCTVVDEHLPQRKQYGLFRAINQREIFNMIISTSHQKSCLTKVHHLHCLFRKPKKDLWSSAQLSVCFDLTAHYLLFPLVNKFPGKGRDCYHSLSQMIK